MTASLATLLPLAQGEDFFQERSGTGCVQENGFFCAQWAFDNFDRYVTPLLEHVVLVSVSVAAGLAIALGFAVLSHRRRWLVPPLVGFTGVLYTIPSLAFFVLLLPITGFGRTTAIIALTAYTLQIIYRNIVAGLANVPAAAKDAGTGMGMTDRQLLWRVELPLALPEIVAGLRIATVSTVAIATLAVFAGAGGLGDPLLAQITFRTNVLVAGGLAILLAIAFDVLLVTAGRLVSPWRKVRVV
ncbi:MAG TPA: ABC transporter permease [Solirubrobacterales bacterium]|jgi:osmoprotectant transport system permease protein|nr:ABC transporter permease [Solirubrobacterales bacterium]